MSHDEYWYGNVWLAESYREADQIARERENVGYWMQGMYIYEAVSIVVSNAFKKPGSYPQRYTSEPYDFYGREKTEKEIEREEEKERLQAMLYMSNMVRAGKNWKSGG